MGVVDMSAYMDKHDIDTDAAGKKAPFEKPLIGFKHFVEHGTDEGLDIAITQVIVVFAACCSFCSVFTAALPRKTSRRGCIGRKWYLGWCRCRRRQTLLRPFLFVAVGAFRAATALVLKHANQLFVAFTYVVDAAYHTQVVPVYLLGNFNARKYLRANKNAKQEMAPPRPGKFDEDGYR